MLKDHMMKSTLTDLRLTREWGQQRSSTAISRMVRRLAASCPKDSQITVPSLLLRQQQSPRHWTIIGTWILYSTMSLSSLTQCLACRQLEAKILTTLSFARSWISSGHWATKALRPWARGVHHAPPPPPPPTSLQNYVFLNPQSIHNKKWDVNSKNIGTHYWFTALF